MTDKTLRINITAETSGIDKIDAAFNRLVTKLTNTEEAYKALNREQQGFSDSQIEILKNLERIKAEEDGQTKALKAQKDLLISATKSYQDMVAKLTLTSAEYVNNKRALAGWTSEQITHIQFLEKERKALDAVTESLNKQAISRANQASKDNRGYVPNSGGLVGDNRAMLAANQALADNTAKLKENGKASEETARHTRNLFLRVGEAIGSYRIWNALINTVFNGPSTITKVGIELEATQSILQSTMGSAAGAAGAMKFLDDEAKRTGITISTLRTSWRDFSASTTLAGMTLSSTSAMFSNLNTVITALHLTSDRAQGVFNAMAQIFNKSKVQSEELVKQLGNLLPGAFASFAASVHDANGKIGISTQELSARMKKGTVLAKDTMEDFAKFMSDKFVASFALASTGMNATIGRMQTSFTHLGESIYGLSSGPIVAVVKGVTRIADTMSRAISATDDYKNSLTVLKSVIEGTLVVALGSALLNVTKLKVALSLLTLPNLLLTGLAAAASYIAYIYNKVQAPLDKLKEAQAQIQEANSQKLFEDKTATITMRVENAEPIRKALKELADLKAAYDDFRRQSSPTRLSSKDEYDTFQKTSGDFIQALEQKAKLIEDAKIAERAKMESFDKEQADRAMALQQTSSSIDLKGIKDHIKDTKLLLNEKLDILDSAAKLEQNLTQESISKIQALHTQGTTTEIEYQHNLNMAYESGFAKQKQLIEEKIALVEKERSALAIPTQPKTLLNEDELAILTSYNKALAENTIKVNGTRVAFEVANKETSISVDLAKQYITELQQQADEIASQVTSEDKLTDSKKRTIELDTKVRTLKEQLTEISTTESNRARTAAAELGNLSKDEVNRLETERIKYMELTGEIDKARNAKAELAKKEIDDAVPRLATPIRTQIKENIQAEAINAANQSAITYQETLNNINRSTRDLGVTSTGAFDVINQGFGGLVGTFQNLTDAIKSSTDAIADNKLEALKTANDPSLDNKKKFELAALYTKKEIALEKDKVANSLTGTRQIATAVSGMLKKNSTEYRVAHAIEMGLATAELAMQTMKMFGIGAVTAAETASVAPSVTASMTKGTAKAAEAVATQATAGPYIGFALMAAMAAAMAAIGFFVGGGSTKVPDKPTTSPDTGTVLGDKSAQSTSLENISTLLEDIHAKEYKELRGINNGVNAMTQGITNTVTRMFQAGGLPNVALPKSTQFSGLGGALHMGAVLGSGGLANFDPISKAITSFLFGGKKTSTVVGQGIATGPSNIGNILANDKFYASYFADIETKTKGGLFTKGKTEYSRIYQQMDAATNDALTGLFRNVGKTMFGLAEQLGVGLGQRVKNYVIPAMFIDLQGLSGEAATSKMNAVISTMLDTMSNAVFGDIVGKYQKLGEGMLETAVRIIAEVAVVKDALGLSGIELKTNAIEIADGLVQAAGGLKQFQDQFEKYYDKFYTNGEKQARLYSKLTETFAELGTVLPETQRKYRQLLEGLDLNNVADRERYSLLLSLNEAAEAYYSTLRETKDAYYEAFYSAGENQARLASQLNGQFSAVGEKLPATREEFRKLVESLDLTNSADRRRYLILLDLSRAADVYYKSLEDVAAAQREATRAAEEAAAKAREQAAKDIEAAQQIKLNNKIAKTDAALAAYEKLLKTQLDATLKDIEARKKLAQDIVTKWTGLLNQLTSAKATTVVDTLESSALKRAVANAIIAGAAQSARTGGKVNTEGLEGALTEISKPSEQLYSSFADYAIAQARTGNDIEDLSKHATKRLTAAEKNLAQLEASAKAAQEYYNSSLEAARAQIDAMRNVHRAVLSLADAIAKEDAYRRKIANPTTNQNLAIVSAYEKNTGLEISPDRMIHFQEVAKRRGLDQAGIDAKVAGSRDAQIAKLFLDQTGKEINANRLARYLKVMQEGGSLSDVNALIKLTEAYKNSHASGLEQVPFDGYQATLHKNEAVIDAQSMGAIQRYFRTSVASTGNNNAISQELVNELKLLRKTVEEQGKKLESIDKNSKSTADTLDKSSAGGPLLVQVV